MNKKIIKSVSHQILSDYNIRWNMSDTDIFEIGKKILELEDKNKIEKKIKQRAFEIVKGILKMKRYGWKPHKKFDNILKAIGFYNIK